MYANKKQLNNDLIDASCEGNLPMVLDLLKLGAVDSSIAVQYAASCGKLNVVMYLISHAKQYDLDLSELAIRVYLNTAAQNDNLDIVEYLISNFPRNLLNLDDAITKATIHGAKRVVNYLSLLGAKYDSYYDPNYMMRGNY